MRSFYLKSSAALAVVSAVAIPSVASAATFDIAAANGLFAPTFRDTANATTNTTYFGWNPGSFDSDPAVESAEVLSNPTPSVNPDGLSNITLTQSAGGDIISGGNNIYTLFSTPTINVGVPTAGTPGSGATTIIVQALSSGGPFSGPANFGTVEGVSPSFVTGNNASGNGQFWAKYEIPGNLAKYTVDFSLPNHFPIGEIKVDSFYSASAGVYGSDIAVVTPEPGSASLLLAGVVGLIARRRRRAAV